MRRASVPLVHKFANTEIQKQTVRYHSSLLYVILFIIVIPLSVPTITMTANSQQMKRKLDELQEENKRLKLMNDRKDREIEKVLEKKNKEIQLRDSAIQHHKELARQILESEYKKVGKWKSSSGKVANDGAYLE